MAAVAGTYKLAGKDKVTVNLVGSWNQTLLGTDLPRNFKISGKKLTVSFAAKGPTGQDILVTVNATRVE